VKSRRGSLIWCTGYTERKQATRSAERANDASTFSPPIVDVQTPVAVFATAIALQQRTLSLHLPILDEFEDLDTLTEEGIEEYDVRTETDASRINILRVFGELNRPDRLNF